MSNRDGNPFSFVTLVLGIAIGILLMLWLVGLSGGLEKVQP